jgi:hypothetical protein
MTVIVAAVTIPVGALAMLIQVTASKGSRGHVTHAKRWALDHSIGTACLRLPVRLRRGLLLLSER